MLVTTAATAVVVYVTMQAMFGRRTQQVSGPQIRTLAPVFRGMPRAGSCWCVLKEFGSAMRIDK